MVNTPLKNLQDEELVSLFRFKGNTEAMGILFERYQHLAYGVSLKYLKNPEAARDATMQIFEKLLQDLHRHDVQIFRAWLHRVTQNHCLMILRKNNHQTRSVDVFPEYSMEYEDTMHPVLEKEKLLERMELAIKGLNDDQKKCVTLFYLEKKSYQEIMEMTGFNFMQVKSFIQNGKRNLKLKIAEQEND